MNKIKTIVFFITTSFNQRDHERLGIGVLKDNGFEVEVWDLSTCVYPELQEIISYTDLHDYSKPIKFDQKKKIDLAIKELTSTCVIIYGFSYSIKTHFIFRALSKNRIPYCVNKALAIPYVKKNRLTLSYIRTKLKSINLLKLIDYFFCLIPNSYMGIRPATFCFASGDKSVFDFSPTTEILWIHTWDYDLYLKEGMHNEDTGKRFGVFLDSFLPFHEDQYFIQVKPNCSPDKYYPALCHFFDLIESKYGVEIIIAAHPSSHYDNLPDYYNGRTIIHGNTIDLVKKSWFVLAHSSTAINFAILYEKPIIFLTTNELERSELNYTIKAFSSYLGKEPINIDNKFEIDWDQELSIDNLAYDEYAHSYIKRSGTIEKPFWQIVAERLKKYEY